MSDNRRGAGLWSRFRRSRTKAGHEVRASPGVGGGVGGRAPHLIASLVALAGIVTLLSSAISPLSGRVQLFTQVVPISFRAEATSVAALAGLGLLLVAGGLYRRQRRAWWIGLALLLVAGVSHFIKDLDAPSSAFTITLALVLLWTRDEFFARPGPGSARRGLLALPLLGLAAWGFGLLAILTSGERFTPDPSPERAAVAALRGLVGLSLGIRATGPRARWIPGLLPLLGVVTLVSALSLLLRPVVEGLRRGPSDVDRVRAVLRRGTCTDTLAYFSLRSDKSYFFSGGAVVAYRYLWNLGLVSGDPVGAPNQQASAMEAFMGYARSLGWGTAILAGSEELGPAYRDLGFRSFYIGDEAVLDLSEFTLEGRPIRKVRQACHRMRREAYTAEFLSDVDVDDRLRSSLEAVSRSWRGRAPERGFTMALGRPPSPEDPDALTVLARSPTGGVDGYLHLVPCYGPRSGYSLDQMRRRPGTPNGLTEWLIASAALELQARNCSRLSLNFAFLGRLFRDAPLSPWQRVELSIARRLNPYFQIESLHMFNAQFIPQWVPRYIYYEAAMSLPRVALAYLEAETLVRLPLIGVHRQRGARSARWIRQAEAVDA